MKYCDICKEELRASVYRGAKVDGIRKYYHITCWRKLKLKNHTTICDEIELESWNNMPISMRVKDFCSHCEFKCEHGKELIKLNNIRKEEQKCQLIQKKE